MSEFDPPTWYRVNHTADCLWVELLDGRHRVLSSAVLNGGLVEAEHVLNFKVPRHFEGDESPADTLRGVASRLGDSDSNGDSGQWVGMMTAASMDSMRYRREVVQGVELAVLVTCGLDNARRVGDAAEHRAMLTAAEPHGVGSIEIGTINTILLCSVALSTSAMVEAVQMITEAKTAALVTAGISSPVSGALATGTGTDAVAVVSGRGQERVHYCGKHVLFGEVLGRITFNAVLDSIAWYRSPGQSG
ncbi:MAG: adenosylcobinamide amidohydrolase [Pseudomonadota bacterium]|nr:adenosylcobinamide amidohydrolase [Pseudomonadota bacterium]